MVSAEDKALYKRLASLPGWTVAEHFSCGYSGDYNPIDHGGFFYDSRDWTEYGYASVVEFWTDTEHNVLVVQRGTVHKPDDMSGAFACIGLSDPKTQANVHAQIDAARAYCGIEPDGTSYPDLMTFRLADWPHEWRLWRTVASWLAALGS